MATPARPTWRNTLGLAAAILLGWAGSVWLRAAAPVGRDVRANPAAAAILRDTASPRREAPGTDLTADLTLVVFADYACGPCKLADPAMNAAVANDAHVRVIYKDWPIFGAASERAARVAIAAAAQGLYPAVHDRLMATRRPLDAAVLRDAVTAAGGDWPRLLRYLAENRAGIDAQLRSNMAQASALGLRGTPGYLVGPILVEGATDEAGFRKAFARARQPAA